MKKHWEFLIFIVVILLGFHTAVFLESKNVDVKDEIKNFLYEIIQRPTVTGALTLVPSGACAHITSSDTFRLQANASGFECINITTSTVRSEEHTSELQ